MPEARNALTQKLTEISRDFNVPVDVRFETTTNSRIRIENGVATQQSAPLSRAWANVDIQYQRPRATGPVELPSLEEIDLYDKNPPKNPDEAFTRYLNAIKANFVPLS